MDNGAQRQAGDGMGLDREPEPVNEVDSLRRRIAELEARNLVLEQLATTDELTGLLNRRAFEQRLGEEISRCTRHDRSVSVLLLDLDNFKQVNDTGGHHTGDEILRSVSTCMRTIFRQTDVLARWGGEEFGVILPDTDTQGAVEAAERIRENISAIRFREIGITASIGVAGFSRETVSAQAIMRAADRQLYRAKLEGRNRVCVEGGLDECD